MSKKRSWQELPIGGVAFGGTALEVKTGLWRSSRPVIDLDRCVSCMKCWFQCPDLSIRLDESCRVCGVNLFYCKGCGVCAKVCPVSAITMRLEAEFGGEDEELGEYPGEVGEHVG